MRFLTRLLAWLAAIGLAAVVTLGILIQLDRRPLVAHDIRITDREHAWVRDWLSQLKPQDKRPGDILTLALSERELNLIANDLLDRFGQGRAAIQLEKGRAKVAASLGVPWDPAGTFVNLELDLVAGERLVVDGFQRVKPGDKVSPQPVVLKTSKGEAGPPQAPEDGLRPRNGQGVNIATPQAGAPR